MTDNLINATLAATGWSKQGLAERLGVNKSSVQDWTQGRRPPRESVYADLARVLAEQQAQVAALIEALAAASPERKKPAAS